MYEIITFPNGLRIVIEKITHVKSVTVGVWIGAGSCRETKENNGISHFIEHMLFKGTQRRTAKEIAGAIDDIGGQINAFTSRDCTCYYAKVLTNHLDVAVDVLADMLFNSLFDEKDMILEKNVIAEEINMYEDSTEELAHDLLMEKAWNNNSLGYSILGTEKALKKISVEDIKEYLHRCYVPENAVVSVVGNFDREQLLGLLREKFSDWEKGTVALEELSEPKFYSDFSQVNKDIEQTHLCIGYKALPRGHELAYSLMVVNTILGSGMSSRLFQNIREEKGLAYSIYSYQTTFAKAGLFTIYAGMNPARLEQVQSLIYEEINRLKKDSITPDELQKCKEQLKGNLILGLESTSSRMHTFGQSLLLINKIRTLDEMIEKIDSVDLDKINSVIDLVFADNNPPAIAIVQKNQQIS